MTDEMVHDPRQTGMQATSPSGVLTEAARIAGQIPFVASPYPCRSTTPSSARAPCTKYRTATLDQFSTIIVDDGIDEDTLTHLQENHPDVYIAPR
ncbi:hypothetical protein [Longimycelium tulufanense]|uniref:hypothetical protein n=1 Tax=Longimycelium tulufanense TaxID=907463 RepID=UPI00166452B2|nr:hypothetical protein [Longimycelium tulufanense]